MEKDNNLKMFVFQDIPISGQELISVVSKFDDIGKKGFKYIQ